MNAINNGGKTNYYDLPKPNKSDIAEIIKRLLQSDIGAESCCTCIAGLYPETLNDLIEYKHMQPWQHEVFKACYALTDRANKNGGSVVREINKIIYYANRGLQIELNKENK